VRPTGSKLVLIGMPAILAAGVTTGLSLGSSSSASTSPGGNPPESRSFAATTTATSATFPHPSGQSHAEGSKALFSTTSAPPPKVDLPAGLPDLSCPTATVTVHNAAGLQAALHAARPGTVIRLADGVYYGRFTGTGAGTKAHPIWLCGAQMAIIDDRQDDTGAAPAQGAGYYGFHLVNASWWNLVGISVRNAQKGVMLDHSSHDTLYGLTVYNIGDEAIHLRDFSTDNVVEGCVIRDTGLRKAEFGEGIYVGTANHNWPSYSSGRPDASNYNVVRYNDIADTTAENIDVKEGTTGGFIQGNHLDGAGSSAAESWIDVKGNSYRVEGNIGVHAAAQPRGAGVETFVLYAGFGNDNLFSDNNWDFAPGTARYGFDIHGGTGNVVDCNNEVTGAGDLANIACTQ
jgi:hypothetical protein